ncbi:hypothetical protein [Streptomyces hokutonensis]|uniref:hypothetical protein n=1 Tax=Streptomyces hokutonensis TaxID=1306990 RepID=UPI00036E9D57|nr:hypothetical protein [Streptomyces hokutonensis]
MAQAAEREAQMENGLISTYEEFEFDLTPIPEPRPVLRTPALHRTPASRRRIRGR